jgi:hypothetical protein
MWLIVGLTAVGHAWGEQQINRDESSEESPQKAQFGSWGDEEKEDAWTWFGMGYESRRRSGSGHIAATGSRKNDN